MDAATVSHGVSVYSPVYAGTKLYCLVTEANVCVNNLSKVALDSAAAGIEPAIFSRKYNVLTSTPPRNGAIPLLCFIIVSLKWCSVGIGCLLFAVCVCVCVCVCVRACVCACVAAKAHRMLSILPNHLDLLKEFPANFVFVVLQHSPDKYVSSYVMYSVGRDCVNTCIGT